MADIRPVGHVLLDLEPLLEELVDVHELQYADVLQLVFAWLEVHRPTAREVFVADGSSPEFYYGPKRPMHKKKGKHSERS